MREVVIKHTYPPVAVDNCEWSEDTLFVAVKKDHKLLLVKTQKGLFQWLNSKTVQLEPPEYGTVPKALADCLIGGYTAYEHTRKDVPFSI